MVEKFITEAYKERAKTVLDEACKGRATANFEFPLITKDGKRSEVSLNATTRRDASGQATGIVGVGQDIIERNKLTAESQREADDRTRLVETANTPIFGVDLKGRVTE